MSMKQIEDIFPRMNEEWTVEINVLRKPLQKNARFSPTKYQRLLLVDAMGTHVQATLFSSNIEIFKNTLQLGKNYYLSNALVTESKSEYRVGNYPYQWIINTRTLVEEVPIVKIGFSPTLFNFTPFNQLQLHIGTQRLVEIVGIAVTMFPVKTVNVKGDLLQVQELLLVDSDLCSVRLSMWSQFIGNECESISSIIDKRPVIIATDLTISSFHGVSVSTTTNSSIILDSADIVFRTLQQWSVENLTKLDYFCRSSIDLMSRSGPSSLFPGKEEVISIIDLCQKPVSVGPIWIRALASLQNMNQQFFYFGCSKCFKSTRHRGAAVFVCDTCHTNDVHAVERCCVEVDLTDDSGVVKAVLFGSDAENIMSIKVDALIGITREELTTKVVQSFDAQKSVLRYFKLKVSQQNFENYSSSRFVVLSVVEDISSNLHPSPSELLLPMPSSILQTVKIESGSSSTVTLPRKKHDRSPD